MEFRFLRGQWIVPAAFFFLLPFPVTRAVVPPEQAQLPNFDLRQQSPRAAAVSPYQQAAAASLRARLPQARVDFHPVTGAPKSISATGQFLTGAKGEGKAVSPATAAGLAADDPHRAVKAFLREHRPLFGHGPEALDVARVKREFVAPHTGMKTVVWEQEVDGIPLFEAVLIAHTTARGELVTLSSQFVPDPPTAANRDTPGRAALVGGPAISAQQAVAVSARDIGEALEEKDLLPGTEAANLSSVDKRQTFQSAALKGNAESKLIWLPVGPDRLRLCWDVILMSRSRGEMFRVLVDAETGELWLRHCLTDYLSEASYRVFTSDSPTPLSPGHPTPLTNQPPLLARTLVTISALDTNASPNGWVDDGVNETLGNNVYAHTDRNGDNLADLPRPQGSPFRVFDFTMDLSSEDPTNYSAAAATQLFYWCNWMHDTLYGLGFTEAAGNFQKDNFGRGGAGNDAVLADAQDGSGLNNANFSTPPDGSAGRMQMYIFNGPSPRRDGDFDAEVVLHEYTHGLSDRRVGGGVGISALQSGGMGEGWSDFYALALLSEAGDDVNGNYAVAAYVSKDLFGQTENYYYGIRRYPYSTDLARNPLTFKDIDPMQSSSHPGVPINPLAGGGGASEVHNQGEVWCVTLWEARANLINKCGWAVGNQLILQLVTDGMNLSPPNPDFLQARDAILQADQVLTGGTNQYELWAAFAKRGLGFQALAPVSSTTTGVIEDFSLPDGLRVAPSAAVEFRGPVGGPFLPLVRSYTLTNAGNAPLNWSAHAGSWFVLSNAAGALAPGGTATVTVSPSAAAAVLPAVIASDSITFSNTTSGIPQSRTVTIRIGQPDFFTEIFNAGEFDLAFTTLTFTPDGSSSFYRLCREPAVTFPTDPAGGAPVTLGDDTYSLRTLAGGATVSIYGQSGSSFYIGANGHLTLTAGHTDFFYPELAVYFERARVSALYTDLNPATGGSVSWRQLSNRVAVTYLAVPEYGMNNTNSFQMELFFNGVIRVTWLQIDAVNAVVGLSRGTGYPVGFVESDFSLTPACSIIDNSTPELAEIADRVASVGAPLVITNTATDDDLPAQTLTFSLDAAPIGARLNPTNGIFRWTPNSGQGSTTNVITVRVTDNGTPNLIATRTFTVIVMPYVEVSLGIGKVVLIAGESTNLAVNVISSLPLTNLGFSLSFTADRLTNFVATNWGPNIAWVNVQQSVSSQAEFYLPTVTGSVIQGTQQLFTVSFTALTNQSSAFVPVSVEDVAAAETNGTAFTSGVGVGTRLIIIGQEPLLEGALGTNDQRSVVLYGQPGALYTLESATNLLTGTLWLPVLEHFAQTNKAQAIMVPTVPTRTIFYRARKE